MTAKIARPRLPRTRAQIEAGNINFLNGRLHYARCVISTLIPELQKASNREASDTPEREANLTVALLYSDVATRLMCAEREVRRAIAAHKILDKHLSYRRKLDNLKLQKMSVKEIAGLRATQSAAKLLNKD